jgi:hypothetical protein
LAAVAAFIVAYPLETLLSTNARIEFHRELGVAVGMDQERSRWGGWRHGTVGGIGWVQDIGARSKGNTEVAVAVAAGSCHHSGRALPGDGQVGTGKGLVGADGGLLLDRAGRANHGDTLDTTVERLGRRVAAGGAGRDPEGNKGQDEQADGSHTPCDGWDPQLVPVDAAVRQ